MAQHKTINLLKTLRDVFTIIFLLFDQRVSNVNLIDNFLSQHAEYFFFSFLFLKTESEYVALETRKDFYASGRVDFFFFLNWNNGNNTGFFSVLPLFLFVTGSHFIALVVLKLSM